MKLINALVKSMEWSIKTKKSQLLCQRSKASKKRISKQHLNNKKVKGNKPIPESKVQSSGNDVKSDYFSVVTKSSKLVENSQNSLNLSLVLKKLQVVRQILRQILNDLNNLLIFHNKTYSNNCKKCQKFVHNDDRNQLETSDIIDSLMQSLGIEKMVKDHLGSRGEYNSQTTDNLTKDSTMQIIGSEIPALGESTDSSDEQTSNGSEISLNFTTATSKSLCNPWKTQFTSKETKSTHNFRCELILFLSMLREIICKVSDISLNQPLKRSNYIGFPTTDKQIQKLKEEYFVILHYVTELIEGPRYQLHRYHIKRSYNKVMLQLKINILVSKKHIFEILYEMSKLKKSMKRYQSYVSQRQKSSSLNEPPSISSQVLIKIQDICSKLKDSQVTLQHSKTIKECESLPPQCKRQNINFNQEISTKAKEITTSDIWSKNEKDEKVECKMTSKIPNSESQQDPHKFENSFQEDKPSTQRLNQNQSRLETRLQKEKNLPDKEHELLQKIYQLLEDYLEKTKEMDLEKIKDFMERETMNYSMELRRLYSLNNLSDLLPMDTSLKQQKESKLLNIPRPNQFTTLPTYSKNDPIKCIYKGPQIFSTTDDEKRRTKNSCILPGSSTQKDQTQLDQTTRNLMVNPESNYKESEQKEKLKNAFCVSRFLDKHPRHTQDSFQNLYLQAKEKKMERMDTSRNHCTNHDSIKICTTSNRELLQEAKQAENTNYCSSNKSNKNQDQMKDKEKYEVTSSIDQELGSPKYYQTKKGEGLGEKVKRPKVFEQNDIRFMGANGNRGQTGTTEGDEHTNVHNSEILKTTKTQKYKKDESSLFHEQEHSNNFSKFHIQRTNLISYPDDGCHKSKTNAHKLHETNEKIDHLKEGKKKENSNPLIEKTLLNSKAQSHQMIKNKQNLYKKATHQILYKSKSENNIEPTAGSIEFPNERYLGDFSYPKTKLTDKNSALQLKQLKKTRNESYEETKKKDQMVQISIGDESTHTNLREIREKKMAQHHEKKSKWHTRKKLRTKLSRKALSGTIENWDKSLNYDHPLGNKCITTDELRQKREPSERIKMQHPVNIIGDWSASSIIYRNQMPTITSHEPWTYSIHFSKQSKNVVSGDTACNVSGTQDINKQRFGKEGDTGQTISHLDYASKRIARKEENKDYFCNEIKNEASSIKEQFLEKKILGEFETLPKMNTISTILREEPFANENRRQVPKNIGFKYFTPENRSVSNSGLQLKKIEKTNKSILKNQQILNENRQEIPLDEMTSIFGFENLFSMRNKENNFQKWNDSDEIATSSLSDLERVSKNYFEKYKSECQITQPDLSLVERPKTTAKNIEYTQAKLDSILRKNFRADSLYDDNAIFLSCGENKELTVLPTSKAGQKTLSACNESLTSFYVDCLVLMNAKEVNDGKTTDPEDYLGSKSKDHSQKDSAKTELEGQQMKNTDNESKLSKKAQTIAVKSHRQKIRERKRRLKASSTRQKMPKGIKVPVKLHSIVNLEPSHIETLTEALYPKAQLTICFLKNKMYAEELHEEVLTQSIKYDNSHRRRLHTAAESNIRKAGTLYYADSSERKKSLPKITLEEKQTDGIENDKNKAMTLLANQTPMQLYDYNGLPLTNIGGEPLKNAYGESLVIFDRNGRPISDNNMNIIFDSKHKPNTSHKFNPYRPSRNNPFKVQLTNEQGQPLILYNELGHPMTDDIGYCLYDIDGNPLIKFDSCGRPISDCKGNPLHTPSNREIKKSWPKNGTSLNNREQHLPTTPSDSLPSHDNGTNFDFDNNTQNSLAISSLKTTDDFLVKERWNNIELENDQLDLISLILTNGYSISSKSTTGSECNVEAADRFSIGSDNPIRSLQKQQRTTTNHIILDTEHDHHQQKNNTRKTAQKKIKDSEDEKIVKKYKDARPNTIIVPKEDCKSQIKDLNQCKRLNCKKNDSSFRKENEEIENFSLQNGFIPKIPGRYLSEREDEKHYLNSCDYQEYEKPRHQNRVTAENSESCFESIEIMNEIFQSTLMDTFDKNPNEGVFPYRSCSEHSNYSLLSQSFNRSITEYSENMIRIFAEDASCEKKFDFDKLR